MHAFLGCRFYGLIVTILVRAILRDLWTTRHCHNFYHHNRERMAVEPTCLC